MPYIDEEYLANLKNSLDSSETVFNDSEESKDAFERIERLATRSEQSSKLLRDRLIREGYPEEAIDQALQRAKSCSLVDDIRYGEALVRTRVNAYKGMRSIANELESLDISQTMSELCPEYAFDDEWELERALKFLEKKPPTTKNKHDGAYRRLTTKGYASSIVSKAARLWCEAQEVARR